MSNHPEPGTAADLERLAAAHPRWSISAAWVAVPSGPDARQFAARRAGTEVRAWTGPELSAKIAEAEIANGWPSA